jgi:putative two-component system response regulator
MFLTNKSDTASEIKGLSLGAIDYIFKPFKEEVLLKRLDLHLQLKNYSSGLEEEVFEKTIVVHEMQDAILETVAELVECRDDVTGGHIERTQKYLKLLVNLAIQSGVYLKEFSTWDIDLFVMSSQLHDVGKIYIRDDILLKPGKLTYQEFEDMKEHASHGSDIIKKIETKTKDNMFLEHARLLAGSHHEKWDGSGYPLGSRGFDIPLQGRLMAIVDVYDALINDRPYKKAMPHSEAVEIIREGKGSHFDPFLCEIFVKHEDEFEMLKPQVTFA